MPTIDLNWDLPEQRPGIRRARVSGVVASTSSTGYAMLRVTFDLDGGGSILDNIMLDGPGKGMGLAKLSRLGVPKDAPSLDTEALIGITLDLVLVQEDYQGQARLKVDSKANAAPYRLGYGERVVGAQSGAPPMTTGEEDPGIPF